MSCAGLMSDVSVSSFEDHFLARFGVKEFRDEEFRDVLARFGVIGSEEFRDDFLARFGVIGVSEIFRVQHCNTSVERGDLLGEDKSILYLPIGYTV